MPKYKLSHKLELNTVARNCHGKVFLPTAKSIHNGKINFAVLFYECNDHTLIDIYLRKLFSGL